MSQKTHGRRVALAAALAGLASVAAAQPRNAEAQAEPSFPLVRASPGLYASGNECAPDLAEAVWGEGGKLLGYVCVRSPSRR